MCVYVYVFLSLSMWECHVQSPLTVLAAYEAKGLSESDARVVVETLSRSDITLVRR